MRIEVAKVRWT